MSEVLSVLLVEDEWLIAEEIAHLLRVAGLRVVGPVPSAAQALALLGGEPIDAALLDVSLGADESYAVADELAARGIPFGFVTGFEETEIPPRFRDRPYLAKPICREHLAAALARLLHGGG